MSVNLGLLISLDGISSDHLNALLDELFRLCLTHVELPDKALELVVIADETRFGSSIHSFQERFGRRLDYTANEIHCAVGKTIPFRASPSEVRSVVVIRDNIVYETLAPINDGKEYRDWTVMEQLCFNSIVHELCHCKDNYLRSDDGDLPPDADGWFRVRQIARYNTHILIDEFAACALSGSSVTSQLYEHFVETWHETVRNMLAKVDELRMKYEGGDESALRPLAFNAAQLFWLIVIELGKITGSALGNPDLPQVSPSMWEGAVSDVEEILSEVVSQLRMLWTQYPDWSEDSFTPFFELWNRLALAYGYRFFESAEADGLRLF
jgi:hypothetical protein